MPFKKQKRGLKRRISPGAPQNETLQQRSARKKKRTKDQIKQKLRNKYGEQKIETTNVKKENNVMRMIYNQNEQRIKYLNVNKENNEEKMKKNYKWEGIKHVNVKKEKMKKN